MKYNLPSNSGYQKIKLEEALERLRLAVKNAGVGADGMERAFKELTEAGNRAIERWNETAPKFFQ